MLKEAVEKLMSECGVPLVWRGMGRVPYRSHRAELDSHRNDGKVSYEQEEDYDDEPMNDFDRLERNSQRNRDVDDFWSSRYGDEEDQEELDDLEDDFDEEGMMDVDPEEFDADAELGDLQDEDNPDRQGLIRVVPNAHLVYKRADEDGTFEELWIYNTGEDFSLELETRRAILAGTDIEMNRMRSEDGAQQYDLWSAGNAQLLHITGLPS